MRFAFIAVEKATYPVRVLCRTLAVSRAGFYAWHTRPPAPRTRQDQRLGVEIWRSTPRPASAMAVRACTPSSGSAGSGWAASGSPA